MNCPNCGAPIHGVVCEYCGTVSPLYEEKHQEYESRIAKLNAELENAKKTDYRLSAIGKWVVSG